MHKKHWTEKEIEYLERYFPVQGEYVVARKLGRTPVAVRKKAGERLLVFGWSPGYMPLYVLAGMAGRGQSAVKRAAKRANALTFLKRGKTGGRLCVDRKWAQAYLAETEACSDANELIAAGFLSVDQAAELIGISAETIRKHLKKPTGSVGELFEGVTPVLAGGPTFGRGYLLNPHEVELVRRRMDEHRRVEQTGVQARVLADEFQVTVETVVAESERVGAPVTIALSGRLLTPARFIPGGMAARVREALAKRLERPEGAISIREAAEEWNVTREYVLSTAERFGISLPQYRTEGSNVLSYFVTREIRDELEEVIKLPPVVPRGYVLLGKIRDELNIPLGRLMELARAEKVEVKQFRTPHAARVRPYVSNAGAKKLRNAVHARRTPPAGMFTVKELGEQLGESASTVAKRLQRLKFDRVRGVRRDGSGSAYYYPKEALQALKEEALSRTPPADYVTVRELANEVGRDESTIVRALQKLEIQPAFRAPRSGGGVRNYYSPKQREMVLTETGWFTEAKAA